MRPASHKPGKIYATAKTYKFNSLDDIAVDNLKFCQIISQIGTYTYNASRVISQLKTNIKLMTLKHLHQ